MLAVDGRRKTGKGVINRRASLILTTTHAQMTRQGWEEYHSLPFISQAWKLCNGPGKIHRRKEEKQREREREREGGREIETERDR